MDKMTESAFITMAIGVFFFIFGGIFLFDRVLMIGGHIIFSVGVLLLLKPLSNFKNPESRKNFGLFVCGTSLVVCGFSLCGLLLQLLSVYHTIANQLPSARQMIMRNVLRAWRIFTFFRF